MTETLMIQKVAYILVSFCQGEWFIVSIFSSEKNLLQILKNGKN